MPNVSEAPEVVELDLVKPTGEKKASWRVDSCNSVADKVFSARAIIAYSVVHHDVRNIDIRRHVN